MKTVKCESGVKGWQSRLQKNYNSLEEFVSYCEIYGIHTRLGFDTPEEAWDENPIIQGSVIPSDLKLVA